MVKTEFIKPNRTWVPGSESTGDFDDPRVILLGKGDPRAYLLSGHDCVTFQGLDTPTYVTIGKNASDESLAEVHTRYGVPLADLQEFRAMQSSFPKISK